MIHGTGARSLETIRVERVAGIHRKAVARAMQDDAAPDERLGGLLTARTGECLDLSGGNGCIAEGLQRRHHVQLALGRGRDGSQREVSTARRRRELFERLRTARDDARRLTQPLRMPAYGQGQRRRRFPLAGGQRTAEISLEHGE